MSAFLIYALVDPRTLLVRYVGKSTRGLKRARQHMQPSQLQKVAYRSAWLRSLVACGLECTIVVLEHLDNASALVDAECFWIAYGRASGWPLTNLTDGGEGTLGRVVTEETRERIATALKGDANPAKRADVRTKIATSARMRVRSPLSSSTRAKIAASRTGKKHTAATKARLRALALQRWESM